MCLLHIAQLILFWLQLRTPCCEELCASTCRYWSCLNQCCTCTSTASENGANNSHSFQIKFNNCWKSNVNFQQVSYNIDFVGFCTFNYFFTYKTYDGEISSQCTEAKQKFSCKSREGPRPLPLEEVIKCRLLSRVPNSLSYLSNHLNHLKTNFSRSTRVRMRHIKVMLNQLIIAHCYNYCYINE